MSMGTTKFWPIPQPQWLPLVTVYFTAILDLFGAHLDHPWRYVVVFTSVQNLVAIAAVVSKIWKFEFFARLAWKRLFAPSPKSGFWVSQVEWRVCRQCVQCPPYALYAFYRGRREWRQPAAALLRSPYWVFLNCYIRVHFASTPTSILNLTKKGNHSQNSTMQSA